MIYSAPLRRTLDSSNQYEVKFDDIDAIGSITS